MDQELEVTEVTQPEIEANDVQQDDSGPETMLEAITEAVKPETEEAKQERLRDEAGRFAKKEEEAKPGEVKAEVKDEAKPQDEFAMPDGLSSKAQDRFKSLVSKVHESQAQLQAISGQVEQFREVVRSSGATPEEFSQAVDYIRLVKHGDLEGALRVIDDQRRQISLALGKPLPGADPLSQFPDLRQRVEAYQMDEQAAIELARARSMQHQLEQPFVAQLVVLGLQHFVTLQPSLQFSHQNLLCLQLLAEHFL
jgi:hypothetical protein